jgi:phospholipase/carboxylesterase
VRPVTINNGMAMRAWYDIAMNDIARLPDERGIRESQAASSAHRARARARRGSDAHHPRGLLAGRRHRAAGGTAASGSRWAGSSRFPPTSARGSLDARPRAPTRPRRSSWRTAREDPIVPLALAQRSRAALQSRGYEVEWQDYPMPHSVCGEELEAISGFLARTLGGRGAAPARSSILLP